MPFDTSDLMLNVPTRPGQKLQLGAAIHYTGGKGDEWLIPPGYLTDLASVPQCTRWLQDDNDPSILQAAVLHDFLCDRARGGPTYTTWCFGAAVTVPKAGWLSRRDADGVFRRVLREAGISLPRRWLLWAAVRFGGRFAGGMSAREAGQLALVLLLTVVTLVIPVVTLVVLLGRLAASTLDWKASC